MFGNGQLAMYFGSSAGVKMFRDQGIDTIFLPFLQPERRKWLMTTPYFQVALNRDLEQDAARREKAMQVLHVMLSEDAQEPHPLRKGRTCSATARTYATA